jgi:hypothetical protein
VVVLIDRLHFDNLRIRALIAILILLRAIHKQHLVILVEGRPLFCGGRGWAEGGKALPKPPSTWSLLSLRWAGERSLAVRSV